MKNKIKSLESQVKQLQDEIKDLKTESISVTSSLKEEKGMVIDLGKEINLYHETYKEDLTQYRKLTKQTKTILYKMVGIFSICFSCISVIFTLVSSLIAFFGQNNQNIEINNVWITLSIIFGGMFLFSLFLIWAMFRLLNRWQKTSVNLLGRATT